MISSSRHPSRCGPSCDRCPGHSSSSVSGTRPARRNDPELRGALLALRSVARRMKQPIAEERELAREIKTLTEKLDPQLLDQPGVGPLLAAQVVLSGPTKDGSGARPCRRPAASP